MILPHYVTDNSRWVNRRVLKQPAISSRLRRDGALEKVNISYNRIIKKMQSHHHPASAAGTTGPCPLKPKLFNANLCMCVYPWMCLCVRVQFTSHQQLKSYGDATSILTFLQNYAGPESNPGLQGQYLKHFTTDDSASMLNIDIYSEQE